MRLEQHKLFRGLSGLTEPDTQFGSEHMDRTYPSIYSSDISVIIPAALFVKFMQSSGVDPDRSTPRPPAGE